MTATLLSKTLTRKKIVVVQGKKSLISTANIRLLPTTPLFGRYAVNISIQTPPLSQREQAEKTQLLADMERIAKELRQRNLNNAVSLAMEAARGQGELIEHFAELGRRFGPRSARSSQPKFHVIAGGAA
ncbi:hypothetical protein S101468_01080 [Acetobacter pasteurianus subsp. pasteurianus]|uniref:Uncharacterized protein n=2 Tax=Acetobacter pasteurianus TaxID=438 RepID=A0AAC9X0K4_ACEPA|nr:hypothetical protein S101468_01080 [Acetobacter pasteurianus subsp. pasteurianus]